MHDLDAEDPRVLIALRQGIADGNEVVRCRALLFAVIGGDRYSHGYSV